MITAPQPKNQNANVIATIGIPHIGSLFGLSGKKRLGIIKMYPTIKSPKIKDFHLATLYLSKSK